METVINLMSSLKDTITGIEWKNIVENIISLVILAIPTIKIFGKSFVTKFGEKIAEVSTSKIKTKIEETVKQSFRVELETLKASLNKENKTYEINYAKFQQKRFDVVVELYKKLAIMSGAASEYTNLFVPGENKDRVMKDRAIRFNKACIDFNNYLAVNKLFIEDDLFKELSTHKCKMNDICKQFETCYNKIQLPGFSEEEIMEFIKELGEISEALPNEISNIEKCLRELIFPTK